MASGVVAQPNPVIASNTAAFLPIGDRSKAFTLTTHLLTGRATCLGRGPACEVLARGDNVVLTARNAATLDDLARDPPATALALTLDVTDHAQRREVVHAARERFKTIDVLVNNAGHGYRAAV